MLDESDGLDIKFSEIIDYIKDEKVLHLKNSYGFDGDVVFKIRDCPDYYDELDSKWEDKLTEEIPVEEFKNLYSFNIDIVEATEYGKVINGMGIRVAPKSNNSFYVDDEDGMWVFMEPSDEGCDSDGDGTFIKFTESNQHEGERWHFYVPYHGNEEAVEKIKRYIAEKEEELDYIYYFSDELIDEHEVDILVKHTDSGYMDQHNKLEGKLVVPEDVGDINELLYKAGIKTLMK